MEASDIDMDAFEEDFDDVYRDVPDLVEQLLQEEEELEELYADPHALTRDRKKTPGMVMDNAGVRKIIPDVIAKRRKRKLDE